jgi:hypothetical protein
MARWFNVALGVWLIVSAFLWPHAPEQFTNAWAVGVLVIALALIAATGQAWARYVNVAAAIWLFLATFLLPRVSAGTAWNHVLVAIAVICFALIPNQPSGIVRPVSGPLRS